MQGDEAAEAAALDRALEAQPRNLGALIMRGDGHLRRGDKRAAASFYRVALKAAEGRQPSPNLAAELHRAAAMSKQLARDFEDQLEQKLESAGIPPGRRSRRFELALDMMLGRRQVYLQQPRSFYFPGLPQIEFYERDRFPWLAAIEAETEAIRAELQAVMAAESGFVPYVESEPDRPPMVHRLLGDPSWSAFHLWQGGEPVAGHAERCPRTIAALEQAPMPRIGGRSPMALFSLLRAGAHIAPHNGLLNTRLICHLPLIAPPGCRLRVGNETRSWEEGKALIFDDSIEHEAWNGSGETRVILLFEIWRPEIVEEERRALTAMFEAIGEELPGREG
jgi:aspartyl/asparaginyl beta-hydroxylase (cupin superfamily)